MTAPPGAAAGAAGAAGPDLIAAGWAAAGGVPGTLAWKPCFERVVAELQQALDGDGSPGLLWYPPVMSRRDAERAGYAESFPGLLGSVHALPAGAESRFAVGGTPGGPDFPATDAVLVPAMCYHIYPQLAGQEVPQLARFDLSGYCYRHERTHEYGRLRAYRVREHLAIGTAGAALAWRDEQLERVGAFFRQLGLSIRAEPAADPFFGRAGRLLKNAQLEQQLKFEFVFRGSGGGGGGGIAIASVNYHKDHFGNAFGIRSPEDTAHSACLGFGLERIVLALIHAHGNDRRSWPRIAPLVASVRGHS